MEDLISLVKTISQHKIEKFDLFNSRVNLPYKSRLLYDGILKGNITNENEGLKHLYETNEDRPKLKKLQARLKKRLLNTLFFVQLNKDEFTNKRRASIDVGRELVQIMILNDRNEFKASFSLAKKAYTKSIKYELTDYSILLARRLLYFYSIYYPSQKHKKKIQEDIDKLTIILNAEIKAEQYYNEVSFIYLVKKSKFSDSELSKFKDYIDELEELQQHIKSYRFNLNTYNMVSSYYILIGEYQKCIDICSEALSFFSNKPFEDNLSKFNFRNSLILSAISQRKYDIAERYNSENFKILSKGSYNWYLQCNYQYLILSTQERYQELYNLVLEVVNADNYKKFILQNEYWQVIEAYVQFLIRTGKIDPKLTDSSKQLRTFSLSRFVNDVPAFSKDKRGINIAILIIQFLFLLEERKYSKLIDKLDAIKQYSYRYLKNNASYRSNLFIKMLLKVAEVDFHPKAAERHTGDMLKKLYDSYPSANFQSSEIEVIQYEKLWEIVKDLLAKNHSG